MARGSGRPRYRVRPLAWRAWEDSMEPHLITDIVDALEALPAIELEVEREHRPPVVFHVVCGTVFGARFKVRGVRDQDGLWIEVWEVGRVAGE